MQTTKPKYINIKIKLGDIIPWQENPRMSNKAQARRLIESEKKWGQPLTFAVSPFDEKNMVQLYDGHQRYSAWLTVYGENHIVDARQSDRFLTDEERLEFVVTMHAGAVGAWDWQKLSSFDANNIKELLNSENVESVDAEPAIDRAAELQEKWGTKSGDLWKLGDHRLLIGDCTVRENVERLMGGERADIVFSDIPYGIDYSGGRTQVVRHKPYGKIEGDDVKDVSVFVYPLLELGATDNWVCCSPVNLAPALRPFDERGGVNAIIVWDKKSPGLGYQWVRRQTEFILFETKREKPKDENSEFDLWSISRDDTSEYIHGNQKPIELIIRALSFSRICGSIVADLFAGSGSTIIGAHNLGMTCFAMEKTESTGAVILERFYTATGITPELVE